MMAILYSNADIVTTRLLQVQKADLVAVSNLTLSGEQTIDGVLTSTSTVLCTGQTTSAQNGVYTTSGGAWSRTTALDSDSDLSDWIGRSIEVQIGSGGTVYGLNSLGGLRYRIQPASAAVTLGTDGLPWEVVPGDYPLYSNVLTGPAAQIDVDDIVQIEGANLIIQVWGWSTHTTRDPINVYVGTGGTLDTDGVNNYTYTLHYWHGPSTHAIDVDANAEWLVLSPDSVSQSSGGPILISDYSNTTRFGLAMSNFTWANDTGTPRFNQQRRSEWENVGAINILRLIPVYASFEAGTSINIWVEVR